ncbi:hypothetical protein [Polynucleobacter sp. AP-Feld-500C-C5]|uniref:hypothetical protein n=1 Tax=Polynucleobacter sp. AP-Feld-500C-C5 TaxID=2576924 RepID=UPI001C0CE953|nr:hypothetical protein [Polynucleobacter sp. AP-Feld-500C-C5]MBU3632889.1 hypothetical protein [Polynucleobacter sp. AP-Feld-500C-C5]
MKIGVVPNNDEFDHPADRRRYVHYLNKSGIIFEKANFNKDYDFLYVSISGNLALWAKYKERYRNSKNKPKIIFDLSDDLLKDTWLKNFLRSILYFFQGKNPSFFLSYKQIIKKMIEVSDQIICGSEEQKIDLNKLHQNVVVMRESVSQEIFFKKRSYKLVRKNEIHVFWEGLSHGNAECFNHLKQILQGLSGGKVHLHVVTDPLYCKISSKLNCTQTYSLLTDIFKNTDIYFHLYDWNLVTFSAICSACDIAIIPIPNDPVMMCKPENKLLLLWEIGIPVVTTKTPSYERVMRGADLNFFGSNMNEMIQKTKTLISSEKVRLAYMNNAAKYLNDNCSDNKINKLWNEIFTKDKV